MQLLLWWYSDQDMVVVILCVYVCCLKLEKVNIVGALMIVECIRMQSQTYEFSCTVAYWIQADPP